MARASVKALLESIIKSVDKKSAVYRKLIADKQVHFVTINADKIIGHVKTEMYRREGMGKEGDQATTTTGESVFEDNSKGSAKSAKLKLDFVINKEVPEMCARFYDLAKAKTEKSGAYLVSDLTQIKGRTHFTVLVAEKKGGNVFEYVKSSIKQEVQKPMIAALNKWAKEHSRRDDTKEYSKKTNKKYAGRKDNPSKGVRYEGDTKITMVSKEILSRPEDAMWPLEHMEGHSVSEQRQQLTKKQLEEYDQQELWKLDEKTNAIVKKFLDDLKNAMTWTVDSYDKIGKFDSRSHIEWGSQRENNPKNKKEDIALTAQLEAAILRLEKDESFAGREGSDSMITKVIKASKNALVKEIKGNRKIRRVNLKHEKIKYSKGKVTKRVKKPKITIGSIVAIKTNDKTKTRASFKKKGKSVRKQATAAAMPLELIGLINKELPDTVRANMGNPALTNVTGRFAESTRATDMMMTPQGFPSIGYTYQRDPYGTFEQDADYDPRTLIDRSMREIAAQYAIGRFYTRRV